MKSRPILLLSVIPLAAVLVAFAPRKTDVVAALPANARGTASSQGKKLDMPSKMMDFERLADRTHLVHKEREPAHDLFASHSWNPPPPPAVVATAVPVVPPLPFVYLGKKLEEGRWEVYLDDSGRLLTVRQDDIVEASYKVEQIAPPSLVLTYLPLKIPQTLSIGEPE